MSSMPYNECGIQTSCDSKYLNIPHVQEKLLSTSSTPRVKQAFCRFAHVHVAQVKQQASQHQPQSSRGYMPLQLATTGVDHIRWLCNHIRCQHQGWQAEACCGFAHVSQVKQPASQHQPQSSRQLACPAVM